MNYFFTETEQMIIDTCNEIGKKYFIPTRAKADITKEYPQEVLRAMRDAGLFKVFIPEKYSGMGTNHMWLFLAVETLSKYCAGLVLPLAASALAATPIIIAGSEEQKQKYLTRIANGEIAAFALSEPDAGTDFMAMKTTAKKVLGGYLVSGGKHFITNGGNATIITLFAKTRPDKGARGISAFIIDLKENKEGFQVVGLEDKLGIRASDTATIAYDNYFVPNSQLLGKENHGMSIIDSTFAESRPGIAAQSLGLASGALEMALEYLSQRKQFGAPVTSFQLVQASLFRAAMKLEAARALAYSAARSADSGYNPKKEACYSKVFASEMCVEVCKDMLILVGGIGVCKEYLAEKLYRDAPITMIYEGSSAILQLVGFQQLMKDFKDKK